MKVHVPYLVSEPPREYPCGYAPRVLHRPLEEQEGLEDVLFVGSKDGSVTALFRRLGRDDSALFEVHSLPFAEADGSPAGGVRVLRAWGREWLLVGRNEGTLELINWRQEIEPLSGSQTSVDADEKIPRLILDPPREAPLVAAGKESVRYATWLDRRRLVFSYREAGTFVAELDGLEPEPRLLRRAILDAQRIDTEDGNLGGIRLAAEIGESGTFLLVDQGCQLCYWQPSSLKALPASEAAWRPRKVTPAFLNDTAYVGPSEGRFKKVRGLILTTDTGVYAVDLRDVPGRQARPLQLPVPGSGVFYMSATYVEFGGRAYMWLTNRRGDSHLFENAPLTQEVDFREWALGFSSLALSQTDSQVLIALGWRDEDALWLVQASRNDRIRIHRFQEISVSPGQNADPFRLLQEEGREPSELLAGLKYFLSRSAKAGGESEETDKPAYAVLAEVLDVLADEEPLRDRLLEFLSQPVTHAATALLRLSAERQDGTAEQHLVAAVKLWNLCLIGLVNRQPQPREEWYLGILRFLRGLAVAAETHPLADHRKTLLPAIEEAIRFARKWGLHGEVNEIRQNLVVPLKILEERRRHPGTWVDELTYSSLLFRRSYSVVLEAPHEPNPGHHAWRLASLEIGAGTLIAVSWRRGGVRLRLIPGSAVDEARWHEAYWIAPEPDHGEAGERLEEEDAAGEAVEASQYGYSRDVLLLSASSKGKADEDIFYLLTATLQRAETSLSAELKLWRGRLSRLNPGDVEWEVVATLPTKENADLASESVIRFLDLGSGLIVVGLRGVRGRGKVALLEISTVVGREELRLVEWYRLPQGERDDLYPASSAQNRVWSLARIHREDERASFLAGCENGEIWQVSIAREGSDNDWRFVGQQLVKRLAAPVTALACRKLGEGLRVFAGARDGTIICFQELVEEKGRFATLWATVERESICFVDTLPYQEGKKSFGLVLAVARNGAAVAIDDRDDMGAAVALDDRDDMEESESTSERKRRPPFPGIRRLRTQVGKTCFAAAAIRPEGWSTQPETWRFLATASSSGELRVISLHYPRYTRERHELFREHLSRLWEIAVLDAAGRPENLRVVDAVYRASPLLPLIPVHWLLDPDLERSKEDEHRIRALLDLGRWWYPWRLRKLRDVREAWSSHQAQSKRIGEGLRQLLRQAWQGGEVDLFQEICLLALKRVNRQICDTGQDGDLKLLGRVYSAVFKAIEASLQLWTGTQQHETRVRCIVAKNLMDGDTFLHVMERIVEYEKDSPERGKESVWYEILTKYIDGIRQLVFKGDILVSLESLRAANHSFLRVCRRLSDARGSADPSAATALTAIPWPFFAEYFQQLIYGATQAFRAKGLSDVLFHEYSRTFALCLSACPEGAVRMVNHLTESRLILDPLSKDDLSARIEGQILVLQASFGVTFLPGLRQLVGEILLRPDLENLWPLKMFEEAFRGANGPGKSTWSEQPRVKIDQDLRELNQGYQVLRSLMEIVKDLSTDARELNLTRQGLNSILDRLQTGFRESAGLYKHSVDFWRDALRQLLSFDRIPLRRSAAKIRPEVVLFTEDLKAWVEESGINLRQRYQEEKIFQPQYQLFEQTLFRLRQAAEGFALGAAVQKNLVVGLLGHHLLEDLDLHVLELREVARNLDPLVIENDEGDPARASRQAEPDSSEAPLSTESRFGSLLVRRAQRALSLPKSLRALAKVLDPATSESQGGGLYGSIEEFVSNEPGSWLSSVGPTDGPELRCEERELLALVLRELDNNHLHYSDFADSSDEKERPHVSWHPGQREFIFAFPVSGGEEEDRWQRLVQKVDTLDLQQPCPPNPDAAVASTGAGLYLSCLAAAMVGWKLSMKLARDPEVPMAKGWCYFHLEVQRGRPQMIPRDSSGETLPEPRRAAPIQLAEEERVKNIVVIDDKPAVALYLWREIGNVPGLGVAEVSEEKARGQFWPDGEIPKPLCTPAGDVAIWWVAATDAQWKVDLARVVREISLEATCYFLVDVRGPADDDDRPAEPAFGGETPNPYNLKDVLADLAEHRPQDPPDRVWLISSYRHGTSILTKTPKTFRKLAARNRERPPDVPDREIHVLVTGAGFELRDPRSDLCLGMPSTSDLLVEWINESFGRGEIARPQNKGYPMPKCFQSELEVAAAQWDLDGYWDALLAAERSRSGGDPLGLAFRENKLREDFRQQLARYDWGYLSQALSAARLPWGVWLSTNYMRFADRAIERQPTSGCDRPWRSIETREEAERLEREILHANQKWWTSKRLLFKLHGDAAHVLTMAIAGEDKTFSSHVQSFAPLYLAARSCLRCLTDDAETVVWHIVGHGLRDRLLVRVVCGLHDASRSQRPHHRFLVVSPAEGAPTDCPEHLPSALLRRELEERRTPGTPDIVSVPSTAERYLASLEAAGLARYARVVERLGARSVAGP